MAGIEGPRVCDCVGGRVPYVDCRGVGIFPVSEVRDLGMPGVARDGFTEGADVSEMGGEGGVGVSETPEEEVLAGGVSKEASVVVGDSSERGDGETAGGSMERVLLLLASDLSALRSLSLVMSVSILRSDSSSLSLCASIRRDSRSCSAAFISSSNMTLRSMVWLYLDSMSSSDDSVLRCFLSKSSLATSISRSRNCSVRLVSRSSVISFCSAFWALAASLFACLCLDFHSSTSYARLLALSLSFCSRFSEASMSFSSSASSSLLEF